MISRKNSGSISPFFPALKEGPALYSYALEVRYIWRDKEYLFTFSFAKSADVRLLKTAEFCDELTETSFYKKNSSIYPEITKVQANVKCPLFIHLTEK